MEKKKKILLFLYCLVLSVPYYYDECVSKRVCVCFDIDEV